VNLPFGRGQGVAAAFASASASTAGGSRPATRIGVGVVERLPLEQGLGEVV
jgi:hypothetical protein